MSSGRSRGSWGSARRLPSGRWQARYRVGADRITAPRTFRTKRDAEVYLATVRADLERGTWRSPDRGEIPLRDYATQWLEQKTNLRPRSREQYEINLRRHVLPHLGDEQLSSITPSIVRAWHSRLMNSPKPGAPTVGKAYRLLHAILATAVEDELIDRNPCVLRGASKDTAVERPIASVAQVFALADAIDPSLRMMVLVAGFTGLRLGELRALRRDRIDLENAMIRVVEQYQELSSGELFLGPPKSAAGRRTVSLPAALIPDLRVHMERFVRPGDDAIIFPGTQGQPLHQKTFRRHWTRALETTGMGGFRFHDLRHTANTLSAGTGASTKELMARMGHSSPRAALIYQHATLERDKVIASQLSRLIEEHEVSR